MKLDRVKENNQAAGKKSTHPVPPKTKETATFTPGETFQMSSGPDTPITYTMPHCAAWLPPVTERVEVAPILAELNSQNATLSDTDGPGVGGGYAASYSLATPVPMSDGLLWHTSDNQPQPQNSKKTVTGDDGPGLGGGYFTRPFKGTGGGLLLEEFPPDAEMADPAGPPKPPDEPPPAPKTKPSGESKDAAAAPGQPPAPAEGPSSFQGVSLSERLSAKFSSDPVALQRLELKAIEHFQQEFAGVSTPAQFQAHTVRLKELVKNGATLEEIQPQAYALARMAAEKALGKTPFDSQMLGALCMENGTIAQMGTGEGKTLTALMPLYLNALSGKGSHLVTVNDYLAQAGYDELKPAFEMLGLSTGLVLREMEADQKRAGYAADVTYLSNDTLGFDYLNDRTVKHPADRVQREPHFALLDEVDQVLLDEARVPLIIAGSQSSDELERHVERGTLFKGIVENLVPGEDFRIDRKAHSAFLTEVGQEVVANELGVLQLSKDDPEYAGKLAAANELRTLLREQAKLTEGEEELPPELKAQRGLKKAWSSLLGKPTTTPQAERLEEIRERKAELLEVFPGADLYSEEAMGDLFFLQNALEARGLFRKGRDYTVENGEVQIVDEFKGRISEGRRFTQGLHQALEIKEGVTANPETHTIASITYPNLFRRYERIAGMTGTAKSAEKEFNENLGLSVVEVPPNKERKRVDYPDKIFHTQKEKFEFIAQRTKELFEEGVPVLVPSISVEMNKYVSDLLTSYGVPNQSLNASDVKTNTPEENAIIGMAGQSGVVTSATNMAGRGVDIKPDALNYKKLAVACDEARRNGEAVIVRLDTPEQAEGLLKWFQLPPDPADHVPFSIGEDALIQPGLVTVEVGGSQAAPDGVKVLDGKDFPGRKLMILATERNLDQRVDDQLRGRAGRQGAPGETQFFVSLEDDLLRIYGDGDREKLSKLLSEKGEDAVRRYIDDAQDRVENMQADGRLQTAKYDQVANKQREVVWGFRDRWVDSRPDVSEAASDEAMDVAGTVKDWMVEAYTKALETELGGKSKVSPARLQEAIDTVSEKFDGFKPQLAEGDGSWKERLDKGLKAQLADLEKQIPATMLEFYQWQSVLESLDEGWTTQLQVLEDEKQGSNLEAYAGREPEQVYIERCFTAFDDMWNGVKTETARKVLPQMVQAAELLSKDAKPGP